ncbi:MAG: hypothetical protein AAGA77_09665 [Bacteroidota bacterium]
MEPIFDDIRFNSNKKIITDSSVFCDATSCFFAQPKNRTLENAYYHFGLVFDSLHFEQNEKWRSDLYTPIKDLFPNVIDPELLLAAQMGKDDEYYYDEDEADKYDPYYWRIIKAKEFKREDWAFFMFLGNIQGILNGRRITLERFNQYLDLFPTVFLEKNKSRLQYNLNFFDELGYFFKIGDALEVVQSSNPVYPEINAWSDEMNH